MPDISSFASRILSASTASASRSHYNPFGGPDRDDNSPLFYSTIDGEVGVNDEDNIMPEPDEEFGRSIHAERGGVDATGRGGIEWREGEDYDDREEEGGDVRVEGVQTGRRKGRTNQSRSLNSSTSAAFVGSRQQPQTTRPGHRHSGHPDRLGQSTSAVGGGRQSGRHLHSSRHSNISAGGHRGGRRKGVERSLIGATGLMLSPPPAIQESDDPFRGEDEVSRRSLSPEMSRRGNPGQKGPKATQSKVHLLDASHISYPGENLDPFTRSAITSPAAQSTRDFDIPYEDHPSPARTGGWRIYQRGVAPPSELEVDYMDEMYEDDGDDDPDREIGPSRSLMETNRRRDRKGADLVAAAKGYQMRMEEDGWSDEGPPGYLVGYEAESDRRASPIRLPSEIDFTPSTNGNEPLPPASKEGDNNPNEPSMKRKGNRLHIYYPKALRRGQQSKSPRDGKRQQVPGEGRGIAEYGEDSEEDVGPTIAEYRDSGWMAIYLFSVLFVAGLYLYCIFALPSSPSSLPKPTPSPPGQRPTIPVPPYSSPLTLLPSPKLILVLSVSSLLFCLSGISYLVWFPLSVKWGVKIVGIGAPLLVLSAGAAGSLWSEEGGGYGIRMFSFVVFLLGGLLLRMSWNRRARMARTVKVLEVSSNILMAHPTIFLICAILSILSLAIAVPFIDIMSRLLASARLRKDGWSLSGWSEMGAMFTLAVWIWTLSLLRGIQRVTVAGAVGWWYFNRHSPNTPPASEIVLASLKRATGPSFGSIALSSLLLTIVSLPVLLLSKLRTLSRSTGVPIFIRGPLLCIYPFLALLLGWAEMISGYALVWVGVTGEGFWESGRKAVGLIARNGTGLLAEGLLIRLLLNLTTITFSVISGLIGYFSSSSSIFNHNSSPTVFALLCAVVPFFTVRLCADILANACDTVWICLNMDLEDGKSHCLKAEDAFAEPDGEGWV